MKEQLCLWLSVVSAIFAVSAAIFWTKSTKVEQKAAPGSEGVGVELIAENGGGAGVRLRKAPSGDVHHP